MDKEKVIKEFEKICGYTMRSHEFQVLNDVLTMLKEQEAVVHCKDCINCVKEPNGELYCDILAVGYEPLGSKKVTDDWFCADGVKKE